MHLIYLLELICNLMGTLFHPHSKIRNQKRQKPTKRKNKNWKRNVEDLFNIFAFCILFVSCKVFILSNYYYYTFRSLQRTERKKKEEEATTTTTVTKQPKNQKKILY